MSAGPDVRRERNRSRIVGALREAGAASRADLARITGLSRTTITSIVSELQAEGMLVEREDGGASERGGRPPRLLSFSRSAGAAVGIDFGKRHLRVAASDLSHTVLAEAERPMQHRRPGRGGPRRGLGAGRGGARRGGRARAAT